MVHLFAVPALRRRLLEVAAVATVTASSLHAVPAGAAAAPRPAVAVVSPDAVSRSDTPAVQLGGEFIGFDLPSTFATAAPTAADSYTVQPGDTLWDIVERHYGHVDSGLLGKVLEANPAIRDPNVILVGWNLVLPGSVGAETEPWADVLPVEVPAHPTSPSISASSTVVTVQRGDTLWDIVDDHYGGATAELVWATVAANPDIDDPNLIFVGQQIVLPPLPGSPATPPVEPTETVPSGQDPAATPNPAPPPAETEPSPTTSPPASTTAPFPTTVGAPPASPPVTAVPTIDIAPETTVLDATSPESDEEPTPAIATIVGWTGAAGLAAGLLALAARRRRREPPAIRHARHEQTAIGVGVVLRETDHVRGVDRAARATADGIEDLVQAW